ncbi:RNA-directed DNA polymerase [Vibrio astriarenae]
MPPSKAFRDNISIADLYVAYRKAKKEAFYNTTSLDSISYSVFEEHLEENIQKLYTRLIDDSSTWWDDICFLGGYLYIPKKLNESNWTKSPNVHFKSMNPLSDWENRFIASKKRKLNAEYRLVIDATVNYQIISALWIIKVGHIFEARLDRNLSFGNKLRRVNSRKGSSKLNLDSPDLFNPYFSDYRAWRSNGLNTMRRLVKKGKEVTAITMDLASFFHNVSPNFLLRKSFQKTLGISLNGFETDFTLKIIKSIHCWYQNTPDYHCEATAALPVGLSASKVISNVLLFQLDREIKEHLSPAYYGRYVDDLFLVYESKGVNQKGSDILSKIRDIIPSISLNYEPDTPPNLKLNFPYASDCKLLFKPEKQKIFTLSSSHGLDLIDQISDQIRAQSSEYRLLPDVPSSASKMAEKALLATDDASVIPDALRKADSISIRRLGFALLARDIQEYTSNLSPLEWRTIRNEFYGLARRYLITPKGIFDLFNFVPRVYRVILENHDFEEAKDFISSIVHCLELIKKTTVIKGKNLNKYMLFREFMYRSLLETSLKCSTSKELDKNPNRTFLNYIEESVRELSAILGREKLNRTEANIHVHRNRLLVSDLGFRPYKEYWYYNEEHVDPGASNYIHLDEETIDRLRLDKIATCLSEITNNTVYWKALAFPTRPLLPPEIALIYPSTLQDSTKLSDAIFAFRGARVRSKNPIGYQAFDNCYLDIPKKHAKHVHVALTNFGVDDNQFLDAIKSTPDRTLQRYENINSLINNILKSKKEVDYVVFPECSIPRRWAFHIAKKLAQRNISLICGVEYYKENRFFRNDCLVSLTTKWPNYNTHFLIRQPKCLPAHSEKQALDEQGLSLYQPTTIREMLPIYKHGDFHFGVLICSDLTNPSNRIHFQGKVDSLFVLAWNKDTNTFSFLVDSAAHDIHTNIIQVNNRTYGDSRVRTPETKPFRRDLVRLKGGLEDYFVIAKIDYQALRTYHQNRGGDQFKPVPIGFECSASRSNITNKGKGTQTSESNQDLCTSTNTSN